MFKAFGNSLGKTKHAFMVQQGQDQERPTEVAMRKRSPPALKKNGEFTKKHNSSFSGAISTSIEDVVLAAKGSTGSNLAYYSFSHLPAASKRILMPSLGSYTLTNYATTEFPPALYLTCQELFGINTSDGQTHIIGVLVPLGCAVPVFNAGGIIGYNMTYGLQKDDHQWDVTSINMLTFDISARITGESIAYPLNQTIVIGFKVASANM